MLFYYYLCSIFLKKCNRADWNKGAGWPKKFDFVREQGKNVGAGWNFFKKILREHALLLGTSE